MCPVVPRTAFAACPYGPADPPSRVGPRLHPPEVALAADQEVTVGTHQPQDDCRSILDLPICLREGR
jgi:hypothetical protein